MRKQKTLGQELVEAVQDALETPGTGRIVRPVDVKSLRQKLHMTQREFSQRYHINLETLRNWEQLKRAPDSTVTAYLTCIAKSPGTIDSLLNK